MLSIPKRFIEQFVNKVQLQTHFIMHFLKHNFYPHRVAHFEYAAARNKIANKTATNSYKDIKESLLKDAKPSHCIVRAKLQ